MLTYIHKKGETNDLTYVLKKNRLIQVSRQFLSSHVIFVAII